MVVSTENQPLPFCSDYLTSVAWAAARGAANPDFVQRLKDGQEIMT